MELDLIKSDKG